MQATAFSDSCNRASKTNHIPFQGWGHTVVELRILWKVHSKDLAESSTLLNCTNKSRLTSSEAMDLIPEGSEKLLCSFSITLLLVYASECLWVPLFEE